MPTSTSAPDDVIAILHGLDRDFMTNAKAGNAQRLVEEFYAVNACLIPPNREPVRGRAAIVQMWKGVIAAGLKDLTLHTSEIHVHGEMAYGIGQYRMTVHPPGGKRTDDAGKYLVIYRKQAGGEWRAAADMFSPQAG